MIADFSSRKAWLGLPRPLETAADMLAESRAQPALQAELLVTLKSILTPTALAAVEKLAAEIARGITA
jgi:hypothetical protein